MGGNEPTSDEDITTALGRAAPLFKGQYTLLVRTCYAHGLAPVLAERLARIYLDAVHIRDGRLIESLLSIALHHCENQYCFVMHSTWLLGLEVEYDEVVDLMEALEAPSGIADRKKWSMVIRCTYFAFQDDLTFASNMALVQQFLSPEEYEDYVHVLSLASLLRTVLLCFPDQIDLHQEPVLTSADTLGQTHQLLSLSNMRVSKRRSRSRDLVSLCMYCKDIKTEDDTWVPIEACIGTLSSETSFSHGMCPKCFQKEFGDIAHDDRG